MSQFCSTGHSLSPPSTDPTWHADDGLSMTVRNCRVCQVLAAMFKGCLLQDVLYPGFGHHSSLSHVLHQSKEYSVQFRTNRLATAVNTYIISVCGARTFTSSIQLPVGECTCRNHTFTALSCPHPCLQHVTTPGTHHTFYVHGSECTNLMYACCVYFTAKFHLVIRLTGEWCTLHPFTDKWFTVLPNENTGRSVLDPHCAIYIRARNLN